MRGGPDIVPFERRQTSELLKVARLFFSAFFGAGRLDARGRKRSLIARRGAVYRVGEPMKKAAEERPIHDRPDELIDLLIGGRFEIEVTGIIHRHHRHGRR